MGSPAGRIVYAPIAGVSMPSDATADIWSFDLNATTHRARLLGFEVTSDSIVAALTTLSLGFATGAGSGGNATGGAQNADDLQTTTPLGILRTADTTVGGDGGRIMAWQWEQLGPIGHIWTPEMAPVCLAGEGFSLQQLTADAWVGSGWVCWEEFEV